MNDLLDFIAYFLGAYFFANAIDGFIRIVRTITQEKKRHPKSGRSKRR